MKSLKDQAQLFASERLIEINDVPMLVYGRGGMTDKPLFLFLTGGGVLARIAYGHPGCDPRDFLDHWLDRQGWGLLTATYPGDHLVFPTPKPDLGLEQWASALAELVSRTEGAATTRPIIAGGWSMGGKLVFALNRALRDLGLALGCFVSLCATPPFPRLDGGAPPPEELLLDGLWDLSAGKRDGMMRDERWLAELAAIAKLEGRCVIEPRAFRDLYRTNVPPRLWGPELDPFFEGQRRRDAYDEFRAAGSFSGRDYPICAAIVPVDARDYRHALVDEAAWGAITIKAMLHSRLRKIRVPALARHDWIRLREKVVGAPRRLTRHLPGGHFFFVGKSGAKATACHLNELHSEVECLGAFFETFGEDGLDGR